MLGGRVEVTWSIVMDEDRLLHVVFRVFRVLFPLKEPGKRWKLAASTALASACLGKYRAAGRLILGIHAEVSEERRVLGGSRPWISGCSGTSVPRVLRR